MHEVDINYFCYLGRLSPCLSGEEKTTMPGESGFMVHPVQIKKTRKEKKNKTIVIL